MKRTIILTVTALALMLLTIPVLADQETCPEAGKVESQVDGDLNDIILEAGTEVCIKGSTDLVIVTADGTSTLYELLGNGHDVSHYTILTVVTTTTTLVEETTTTEVTSTTVEEELTTTLPETTSTVAETTTTSLVILPEGALEDLPTVLIPATTVTAPAASETLPFTGPVEDLGLGVLTGLAALGLGTVALSVARRRDEE